METRGPGSLQPASGCEMMNYQLPTSNMQCGVLRSGLAHSAEPCDRLSWKMCQRKNKTRKERKGRLLPSGLAHFSGRWRLR